MPIILCGVACSKFFMECGYACEYCCEDACQDGYPRGSCFEISEYGEESVSHGCVDEYVCGDVEPVDSGLIDCWAWDLG